MSRDANHWRDEIMLHESALSDARRELAVGDISAEQFAQIEVRESHALIRARAALEAFAFDDVAAPSPLPPVDDARAARKVARDDHQWRDEIALREASLADARREHEAGELSSEQFAEIQERESRALTRARAALEAFSLVEVAPKLPRKRRRSLLLIAFIAFLLILAILLIATLTIRQPGTSSTGAVTLDRSQRVTQLLDEAQADTANRDYVAALAAYQQVLNLDAANVTALTQTGWLDFSAGSAARNVTLTTLGIADLRRAISLAPTSAAPRLYYAIAAAATPGNRALAVREFRVFLSLSPSPAQRAVAAPFLTRLGLGTG